MIYDKISNLHKYIGINKNLNVAIDWLQENTSDNVGFGITKINENVWVKKFESETLSDDNLMCEIHYETADIHIYSGFDDDIIYQISSEVKPNEIIQEYNKENDVTFFKASTKEALVPVSKGMFAIFLPTEVHCPRRNKHHKKIIKTILKIRW